MNELKQESCDTLRWNDTSDRRFQAAVAALPFFLNFIDWSPKDSFDYVLKDAAADAVDAADALLKALDEEKSK